MAEYIKREEAIKRIKKTYCAECNSYNGVRCRACGTGDAIGMIEDAPAADVAPVLHCKDCKYFNKAAPNDKGFCICPASNMEIVPDDFCSYGERKEIVNG